MEHLLAKLFERIKANRAVSAAGFIGLVILIGFAAWNGALGSLAHQALLVRLFGWPPFDVRPAVAMSLDLKIADPGGRTVVFIDDGPCRPGERIVAEVTLAEPAWLTLFLWDGAAAFPFTDTPLEPQHRQGQHIDDILIDGGPGRETVYAIASRHPFSFDRDIAPRLARAAAKGGEKGGAPSHRPLDLPAGFRPDGMTCANVGGGG